MTEKKPSELILERIAELEKKLLMTSTPEKHEHEEPKKLHETIEDIESCPTCAAKFKLKEYNEKKRVEFEKTLRPALQKELKEKLKSKDLLTCDGCGELVEKTADECPTCKGHRAH